MQAEEMRDASGRGYVPKNSKGAERSAAPGLKDSKALRAAAVQVAAEAGRIASGACRKLSMDDGYRLAMRLPCIGSLGGMVVVDLLVHLGLVQQRRAWRQAC